MREVRCGRVWRWKSGREGKKKRPAQHPPQTTTHPHSASDKASLLAWEALGTAAVATSLATTARGAAAAQAPVAIGVTFAAYVAAAGAAGFTVLLNPLRAIVPPILYGGCGGRAALLYLAAEIVGALIAAGVAPLLAPLTAPETETVGERGGGGGGGGGGGARTAAAASVQDPLLATPAPPTPGYGV